MGPKLGRVIMFVRDMKAMTAFYKDIIRLSVVGTPSDDWTVLQGDGWQLALHAAVPKSGSGENGGPRVTSPMKLSFYVEDPRSVRGELQVKGVEMREPVQFDGIVLCDGIDPEGNVFQFSNRV